jgi:hypothetical protein
VASIPNKKLRKIVGRSRQVWLNLRLAVAAVIILSVPSRAVAIEPAYSEAPGSGSQVLNWETGEGKSYIIPAIEVPAFNAGLNGFDRLVYPDATQGGKKVYSSDFSTFWDHAIHEDWKFDQDAFNTNQFSHPYAGTIYYGFARSAGLNYWESFIYTFAGSWLWETAGETTPPSINDQVASGIAGTFFGEPLFRMASLVLEGGGERPGFWRELGAAALSPPMGFNRYVFGERFKPVFPSHDPAIFWRLRLGATVNSHGTSTITPSVINCDFSMTYGIPGKPGYTYDRPFDYFEFELTALAHAKNPVEKLMTRGLLLGEKYQMGDAYRGVWGLYGSYDFISPHVFRVSSTAASLGSTAQYWLAPGVALQGSAMGGIGYGAAGVISGPGERNYHYGVSFQELASLKVSLGETAMLDATEREYYISGLGGSNPDGRELIGRWNAGLTVRVYGRHAIGIQYLFTSRDAKYSGRPSTYQSAEAYSLVYTYLSDKAFGAFDWR